MKFKIGGLPAHPTKGYRVMARPCKANGGRRKLISVGISCLPLSKANRLKVLKWDPVRDHWRAERDESLAVQARRRALKEAVHADG